MSIINEINRSLNELLKYFPDRVKSELLSKGSSSMTKQYSKDELIELNKNVYFTPEIILIKLDKSFNIYVNNKMCNSFYNELIEGFL